MDLTFFTTPLLQCIVCQIHKVRMARPYLALTESRRRGEDDRDVRIGRLNRMETLATGGPERKV